MRRFTNYYNNDEVYGSLPRSNLNNDETMRVDSIPREPVSVCSIGSYIDYAKANEVVWDQTTGYAYPSHSYSHFLSGGEFTIPYSGTEAVAYSFSGIGIILGYTHPIDAKSYYRLSYGNVVKNDTNENQDKIIDDKRGGLPLDAIEGDQGFYSINGYYYGILSGGPVIMGSNPLCDIRFYDIEDTVKLSSYNFIHRTSHTETITATNQKKQIGNTTLLASINIQENELNLEYQKYLGSLGNIKTEHIKEKYWKNINPSGEYFERSSKDLILSVGEIPNIKDTIPNFDPKKLEKDNIEIKEEQPFEYKEGSRLAQEPYYLENLNRFYSTFEIANTQNLQKKLQNALHIRDDGSIVLMDPAGSSIELNGKGEIIITSKTHTKIKSGKNLSVLTGGETRLISKDNITLRSTDASIQNYALNKYQVYTELGEIRHETDGNGNIINKADKANIVNSSSGIENNAKNFIYNKSTVQVSTATRLDNISKQSVLQSDTMYIQGKNLGIISQQNLLLKSSYLYWTGTGFIFDGSGGGIINTSIPVLMNHIHQRGRDKFTYSSCPGAGKCRLVRVETPSINVERPTNETPTVLSQTFSSVESLTHEEKVDPNEIFYNTPWQLESASNWFNLSKTVKEQKVFPNNNKLNTFNGETFVDTNWNNYKITL